MDNGLARILEQYRRPLKPIVLPEPVPVDAVPTPALLVDEPAMDANLQRLQTLLQSRGVGLRPHAKMHKCPEVARRQLALGAVGICCAKVSEAEIMAAAGCDRILITSPVATADKMARVARLAARIDQLQLVVDQPATLPALAAAAAAERTRLQVLVDLDPHMGRTGVALGQPALELVRAIDRHDELHFVGLQQYAGQLMHLTDADERRRRASELAAEGRETRDLIDADGHHVAVFSGGGTGTFDIDSDLHTYTDLQAGSYAFMDAEYRAIAAAGSDRFDYFEPALFVLTTAISQPRAGLLTVDGGYKAFASDTVVPELRDYPSVRFHFGGDEHGILQLPGDGSGPRLGERIYMITSHCDPTINLHDWYWPVQADGLVHELWPVSARGCSA